MRIAVFDPFSGAAGDMILGSLIANGLDPDLLQAELARLPIGGYTVEVQSVSQHGLTGIHVDVVVEDDEHSRTWATIRELIAGSTLPDPVREQALRVFSLLAEAEAKVHGATVDDIHFHEVGGVDAIVDIVGACIGFHALGVERVYSDPVRTGSGWVRAAHGVLPVPAPATAELLAEARVPIAPPLPEEAEVRAELLTPTGAAILAATATFSRPAFTPISTGYGFGTKELPWPNAVRLWIGDTSADDLAESASNPVQDEHEDVRLFETNIDDMNPQFTELLMERLFAAGALDVWLTPATMKKGRPATIVSALASDQDRAEIEAAFIENSTTLGVRSHPVDRAKAERRIVEVTTRWGEVRVKLRGWRERVIDAAPEYDDCAALARESGVPIRDVWNEARRQSDVFIGQKWQSATPLHLVSESGTRR